MLGLNFANQNKSRKCVSKLVIFLNLTEVLPNRKIIFSITKKKFFFRHLIYFLFSFEWCPSSENDEKSTGFSINYKNINSNKFFHLRMILLTVSKNILNQIQRNFNLFVISDSRKFPTFPLLPSNPIFHFSEIFCVNKLLGKTNVSNDFHIFTVCFSLLDK